MTRRGIESRGGRWSASRIVVTIESVERLAITGAPSPTFATDAGGKGATAIRHPFTAHPVHPMVGPHLSSPVDQRQKLRRSSAVAERERSSFPGGSCTPVSVVQQVHG